MPVSAVDFIDLEAETLEEAARLAAEKLGVEENRVELEVLEEAKKGLFGRKAYRVRAYSRAAPPVEEQVAVATEAAPQAPQETPAPPQAAQVLAELTGDYGLYTATESGLYCTVPQPVAGEPPVEYIQLIDEVTQMGFDRVDLDALAEAVESPGAQIRIAPPQPKHIVTKGLIRVDEPKESYLSFDCRDDGIYCEARLKSTPITIEQALREVQAKGLVGVDEEALFSAITEATEPVKIASVQPPEVLKDGAVEVQLDPKEMEAIIRVYPPFGGKAATPADVDQELTARGVVIKPEAELIELLCETAKEVPASIRVSGTKPTAGQNATLEYLFETDTAATGPKEMEDGRVDYRELGIVRSVRKGELLVRKIPATRGESGRTVTGKEIPGLAGKDIVLHGGKGTELSEDGLELRAAIDGRPLLQGNKVVVLPVYDLPGDLDLNTGNVDFVGSVVVRGSVKSGLRIKAEGDVDIFGNVEDAQIFSKAQVRIRGGCVGRGKGEVNAGGDIVVRFAEQMTLKAGGGVKVGEALLHCQVFANNKVVVEGRKALIVGGKILAGDEVKARSIGNRYATLTQIEVGIPPDVREELTNLRKKIEADQENLSKAQKAVESLKNLQKAKGDLPPDKQELLLKLTRTQFQLMAQIKQSIGRRQQLEELTKKESSGKISASDTIYPGVHVTIRDVSMQVKEEMRFVSLVEKGGEIRQASYS